jgi:hypothetical protein
MEEIRMRARRRSQCTICIVPGEEILWAPGHGARHDDEEDL